MNHVNELRGIGPFSNSVVFEVKKFEEISQNNPMKLKPVAAVNENKPQPYKVTTARRNSLSTSVEMQRHLCSTQKTSKKLTPNKAGTRGNILKANLKTPLKSNVKKLKNDQKNHQTPEKPELLKIFEKMRQSNSLRDTKLDCPPLVNNDGHTVTPETSGGHLGTRKVLNGIDSNDPNTKIIKSISGFEVKKVSQIFDNSHCEIYDELEGLNQTKSTNNSNIKSVKLRQDSAVYHKLKAVVCCPNQENENVSRTQSVRLERKKSVKEIKKEMEQRSSQPITNFFRKKEMISDQKHDGKSKK